MASTLLLVASGALSFTLPALPARPAAARAAAPTAIAAWDGGLYPTILADPFDELRGSSLEEIESLVGAANEREDLFGVVGGSYMALDAVLILGVVVTYFLANALKQHYLSQQAPFASWAKEGAAAADWTFDGNVIGWRAGIRLPTLTELRMACVIIGQGAGGKDLVRGRARPHANLPKHPDAPREPRCRAPAHQLPPISSRPSLRAAQVLCASPISKQCSPDDEFSAYYGAPVYVCSV